MTAIARAPLIISRFFFPNLFLVLERREGREKEGERNINVPEIHQSVAPRMPSTGAPVCDPGMCPDQELNWQPLGSQASAQHTEPPQPGLLADFYLIH